MALTEQFGVSERRGLPYRRPAPFCPAPPGSDTERLRSRPEGLSQGFLALSSPQKLEAGRHSSKKGRLGRQRQADQEEGLRVPCRERKRPLRGIGVAIGEMCPIPMSSGRSTSSSTRHLTEGS